VAGLLPPPPPPPIVVVVVVDVQVPICDVPLLLFQLVV